MTLGELADKLRQLEEAVKDVQDAETSLGYGGSPSTVQGKVHQLELAKDYLWQLRDEELRL